ncbi:MAG: hypothetical protein ACK53Y_06510, partial [bacterium]
MYSADRDRVAPNISSAEEMALSSLWVVLSPGKTKDRWSGHSLRASMALRVAFSCPRAFSTIPLL